MKIAPICLFAFSFAAVPMTWASSLRIENKTYLVEADPGSGTFSIAHKGTGKIFAKEGRAGAEAGKAEVIPVSHPKFGKGRGIVIRHENGNRSTIELLDSIPFVVFESVYHNPTKEGVTLNKVNGASMLLDLGIPTKDLNTLGTGGLCQPAQNPGSYSFLAVADPKTRSGVVGGWISHDRASGIVFSPVQGEQLRMEARSDYGRLLIQPQGKARGELFALGYFEDARLGLEQYADAIAKFYAVKLPPNTPGLCTWYMEKHGGTSPTEKEVAELAASAAKNLKPYGFNFAQIDDGWQQGIKENGPARSFMDFRQDRFPSGMKPMAEKISELGLRPGIWFIPFAATSKDPLFQQHPEWFVKDTEGKPYLAKWGGECLDMTHPGARDYLKGLVHRIVNEWGYQFLKLDGFWTGSGTPLRYVNNGYVEDNMGDATFSNPEKTNVEVMRDGVKLVRAAAGPKPFLLGCCLSQNMRSVAGSIGLVDGMRVGPDTGSGEIGWPHASRLWFLNGRVWWNDPDCVSVRESVLLNQARLNASFAAFTGGVFLNSDWMPDMPQERFDILRRCMPLHQLDARPVDIFSTGAPGLWHLTDSQNGKRRDAVAFFNWNPKPAKVSAAPEWIGLPKAQEYVGFDFWARKFVPPFHGEMGGVMPGKSARVLSIRPVAKEPQLISTSRHLLQGMTDVEKEQWDAKARTLSASGKVVANDPYEVRVVVPTGDASWQITKAVLSKEDAAVGAKVEFKQEGPRIRATILSPVSRSVQWKLQFAPGKVEASVPKEIKGLKVECQYQAAWVSWEENGADSYEVTRNDGAVIRTAEPMLMDRSVEAGKTYSYTVCALGWDGIKGAAATADAPKLVQLPPNPPLPSVYLNDLEPVQSGTATTKPNINKNAINHPIRMRGQTWEKGIGVRPPATVVYEIPKDADRFVAVIGLDELDKEDNQQNVRFEVYGDVKEMGEKPELISQSPDLGNKTERTWAFDLPLNSRFKEIHLVVVVPGNPPKRQLANWVNAGFIQK